MSPTRRAPLHSIKEVSPPQTATATSLPCSPTQDEHANTLAGALASPPALEDVFSIGPHAEMPMTPWSARSLGLLSSPASSSYESIPDMAPLRPRIAEPDWEWDMRPTGLGLRGLDELREADHDKEAADDGSLSAVSAVGVPFPPPKSSLRSLADPAAVGAYPSPPKDSVLSATATSGALFPPPPSRSPPSPPLSPVTISSFPPSPLLDAADLVIEAQVAREVLITKQPHQHFLVPIVRSRRERGSVAGKEDTKVSCGHVVQRGERTFAESV